MQRSSKKTRRPPLEHTWISSPSNSVSLPEMALQGTWFPSTLAAQKLPSGSQDLEPVRAPRSRSTHQRSPNPSLPKWACVLPSYIVAGTLGPSQFALLEALQEWWTFRTWRSSGRGGLGVRGGRGRHVQVGRSGGGQGGLGDMGK